MAQELDGCPGTEIAAADTDDHQVLRITADLRRRFFDPGIFFHIRLYRQVDPADKIVAGTGLICQQFLCRQRFLLHPADILFRDKVMRLFVAE